MFDIEEYRKELNNFIDRHLNEKENSETKRLAEIINICSNYSKYYDPRFKNVGNVEMANYFINYHLNNKTISKYEVAFFNIHNFSFINHTYGSDIGTSILANYLYSLQNVIELKLSNIFDPEENGVVCSAGGDNGIIVFKKDFEKKLMNFFRSQGISFFDKKGNPQRINISSHVGINSFLDEFSTPNQIISTANSALNVSKRSTGNTIIEYNEDFKKKIETRQQIESMFEDALKNEEFLVYYQPKIYLHDYSLKGAESLVRWMHNGKMIFPDQFIPVIENNFTIKYLDMYMLNHVCADIAKWLEEGKDVPQISVNLSRATLSINNISDILISIIDNHKIPRSLVQIELTESASDQSDDILAPLVQSLNDNGISTAVDDFGTGYSSLSLIRKLPWNVLKIDKSLLQGAQKKDSREQKMFKTIISMAHEIGLECIVEGVETREDVKLLKESNCFMAQGYYFDKPLPKADFEKKLDYIQL